MLAESVIGIVRAVNGLLEKVNAQGQASLVKSGARLQEGDVLTLLSGEAYIQFIHGFPEALALGKPVNLYGVSPALQYGVEELNEQLVQEALAKGIDPSVILDVLGSAAAGAEAVDQEAMHLLWILCLASDMSQQDIPPDLFPLLMRQTLSNYFGLCQKRQG